MSNQQPNFLMPTRFHLTEIYTHIHRGMEGLKTNVRSLIGERRGLLPMTPEQQAVVDKALKPFNLEERVYLRILNDQNRYYLGDELLYVALLLNCYLPTLSDLEAELRAVYGTQKERFEGNPVLSSSELLFNHLRNENPYYLRKLLNASLSSSKYYLTSTPIKQEVRHSLESQFANWLLRGEKNGTDLLRILSLLDKDGKPTELRDVEDPEVRYISEVMTGLVPLAQFKRSDDTHFSRFVNGLPSIIFWTIGENRTAENPISQEAEDRLMDLAEATKIFIRSLQDHAEQASRLRQYLHHGIPVYSELIKLATAQHNLMSWNFESILHTFSYLIHELTNDRRNEKELGKFFGASNILFTYSKQKGAHIFRE